MLSVEDMDGFDDLTPEQQDLAQEYFTLGYEDGYDEGYEIAEAESTLYEDGKTAGFEEGYQKGFEYEQQRIYSILDMQMKWAEQEGKGN
jgi:flagellar biosynthesis/type III secretory pathway protein FliH